MPRKFLLVDDDALFRRSLSFHLQQAGYQVQTRLKKKQPKQSQIISCNNNL